LSPDGKRLVFARNDLASGTSRIVMVDLVTGQSADLFTAFEESADPQSTPVFSEDGAKVITGRKLEAFGPSSSQLPASFTETDVSNFPNGPFPHTIVRAGGPSSTSTGRTLQPSVGTGGLFAFGIFYSDHTLRPVVVRTNSATSTIFDPAANLDDPAISGPDGVVVFVRSAPSENQSKLVYRPLNALASAPTTALPTIVNAADRFQIHPAFSDDGRYLAFLRLRSFPERLFVFDTQTQLLLNPQGVPVDTLQASPHGSGSFNDGGTVLTVVPVFTRTGIVGRNVLFGLNADSTVGILVQRIVGTTRLLGHRAPKLRLVGRVPLGRFKRGRGIHRVRWDQRVHGTRLRSGTYLVTVRSVTSKLQVRDLGKPVRITIH
jgi:WD40-like Beta Propeller Repeat